MIDNIYQLARVAMLSGSASVTTSSLATRAVPIRTHKQRRGQSAAYHRRIQKKWLTRWGEKYLPCGYVIDNAALGGTGQTIVVHPAIMKQLKEAAK